MIKKLITTTAFFFACALCVFGESDTETARETGWEQLNDSIVAIQCTAGNIFFYGTGAIIQKDGLIITSTSVIPPGAVNIRVRLNDRRDFTAKAVMINEEKEFSVIDIDAEKLPALPLGDSDKIKTGESAYTYGNVLGSISADDRPVLSAGIISGMYSLSKENAYHLEQLTGKYKSAVIETTAAVNGGIDGGPLISQDGRIAGIVILSYSKTRRLGIAVPINIIKPLLKDLLTEEPPAAPKIPAPISFSHINDKFKDAIVSIKITYEEKPAQAAPPTLNKDDDGKPFSRESIAERAEYSVMPDALRTGVVIDPANNYILTSYKNIAGKIKDIKITFQTDKSKTEYAAKTIGWYQDLDLALLKAEAPAKDNIPNLSYKEASDVGQWAIIISVNPDPEALEPVMTSGIVSALNRLQNRKTFQLDADINYNNFGAPVFDIDGKFIGLAANFTHPLEWGLNSGIGLAVESPEILMLLADLKAGKKIEKIPVPFLGVQMARGAMDIKGVRVDTVISASAADTAGIKSGDIIIQFKSTPVTEWHDLANTIRDSKVGETVTFKVLRGDATIELKAVLGQR
ncbi:MAG: trypsin-like peptidase domain-containing protein [Planctomycetes bacterium]|nr:trypsin-like peptidase domain-containing protein [Planctomycetota bacterium]